MTHLESSSVDSLPETPLGGVEEGSAFVGIDSAAIRSIGCCEVEAIGLAASKDLGTGGEEIDMSVADRKAFCRKFAVSPPFEDRLAF